jgi:G3E family GTPase
MMSPDNATGDNLVPVTIVGGFLGAGKTTFLRRLLSTPQGRKLAVVVNDFGDLNIDAKLISEVSDDIVELTNGCLCCSARGDLLIAARRLMLRDPAPDGVIVEASGVARPDLVARSFASNEFGSYFEVETLLTLVDAASFGSLDFDAGELAIDQAAVADLVLLNKVDLAGAAEVLQVTETLKDAVPHIRLIETIEAQVPLDLVMARPGAHRLDGFMSGRQDRPGAGDLFETFTWGTGGLVDLEAFRAALENLPPQVYRLKGFISSRDQPYQPLLVQMVGRRGTIEPFGKAHAEPQCELVAIVRKGAMTRKDFVARFDACVSKRRVEG